MPGARGIHRRRQSAEERVAPHELRTGDVRPCDGRRRHLEGAYVCTDATRNEVGVPEPVAPALGQQLHDERIQPSRNALDPRRRWRRLTVEMLLQHL